jgi:hypothetical protein
MSISHPKRHIKRQTLNERISCLLLLAWNIILVQLISQKEAGVRRTMMGFFFAALLFNGVVFAQNDEILFVPYEEPQFVDNLFSFGINLGRGENNTIVVEGLWTGGPADRAGIRVGDEIVGCSSMPVSSGDIFKLRQLLTDENLKDVKLVVKNKERQREVSLHKKMLLDGKNP